MVWVNDPAKQRDKLAARWKGPYRVIRVMNNGVTYQIQDLSRSNIPTKVIHYNRLKPYVSPYKLEDGGATVEEPKLSTVVPQPSVEQFYRNLPFHVESNLDTPENTSEVQVDKSPVSERRFTRLGRKVKLPDYLSDYELN